MTNTRILLVIDESEGTKRAVMYVARMVGRRRGFWLCLGHILPLVPPQLLEFGGAENPVKEKRVGDFLEADRRQWIAAAKKTVEPALNAARATLREAGVPAGALETRFFDPVEGRDGAEEILKIARGRKCHTVVIGRRSLSWFREFVQGDLAEEFVRRGKGFTIWVVE
jgi:nucleotide-binding universal stress UspA family protein